MNGPRPHAVHRILFVVNDLGFFLSHRLPIAQAAREAGYEVHLATPESPAAAGLASLGIHFHKLPLTRSRMTLAGELRTLSALVRLYRRVAPGLVHHVTLKPVLYGTLAARMAGVGAVVNAISGLGFVFISRGRLAAARRRAAIRAFRFALRHPNMRAILQNPDDVALLTGERVVEPGRVALIRGSGVDLCQFVSRPEVAGEPVVVLASRLLWDKGVREFVEAAREVSRTGPPARFALVGDSDPGNPAAVPPSTLKGWVASGVVEWWGHRQDMPAVLEQCAVVCLPSYREGLPKVLLEAAAAGRPIVASDVPGCREVVRHGENGYLVPPRESRELAAAIRHLLEDAPGRARMGAAGRRLAEREFGVERVCAATLDVYRELLG